MSETNAGQGKKLTRRGFIKWSTALVAVGAAAVGVGVGFGSDILLRPNTVKTTTTTATQTTTVAPPVKTLSYVPPLSPEVQTKVDATVSQLIARHAGETVVLSTHSVGMGMPTGLVNVRIKNGVITSAEPADQVINPGVLREDAAISQTALLQGHIQTRAALQNYTSNKFNNNPDRILYPMKRVGARGDPNAAFVRTTWDDALSTVATQLQNVVSKYGPYSIFPSMTLSQYLGAGVTGWGNVSYGAEDFAAQFMLGAANGNSGEKAPGLLSSKLIVLWSQDPTHTPREAVYYFRLAREAGIPVISIDVKYSVKDDVLADQWIPIRAGTDAAMMCAVANVLITENIYNKSFVQQFVEPTGFQKFSDYIMGVSDGVAKTPEWAEAITGVPAATTRAFAELYAKSTPTFLFFGPGGARQYRGENPARLAVALQAMTGNIGVLGGSVTFDGIVPLNYAFDYLAAPAASYGTVAGSYSSPTLLMSYRWPEAVLYKQQLDAGTMTKAAYQSAIGNPINNPVPNIHLLWLQDANKINQWPNINYQIQAIKAVDFVVALQRHWNITARVADIVLPLAEHFEYYEGFIGLRSGPMVYVPKLVSAQGESKPPEWIFAQLAAKLGYISKYWPSFDPNADFDAQVAAVMQNAYTKWAATPAVQTALGTVPSWSDFQKSPVIRIDTSVPATVPFTAQIKQGTKFGTASGKIEFYSTYLATTDLTQTKWGAAIAPMGIYQDIQYGFFDPNVKTYPLVFLDSHNRHRTHSFQDSNPWIKGEVYRHGLWMSVVDASARGIRDDDQVRVYNQFGQTVVHAYVSQRIVPGSVYLYDGAWSNPSASGMDLGGCPNTLSGGDLNPNGEDPHNELVQVELYQVSG